MSVRCKVAFLSIILMLFSLPLTAVAVQEAQESVNVVKVGNLIVTQMDIDRRAQTIMPMQVGFHGSVGADKIAEIKKTALDDLIARAYKVQYAIDEEISIEASVFDKEWQKMLSKNPQLADYVKTPQVSKLKADIYLNLLARKAEALSVDQMVTITDEEVAAYYAANKAMFFRPKLFTASHVFVKVDPSDNAEEKQIKQARAEELFKRALAGEDFYNLAYYESDDRSKFVGGSLGSFHAGQTVSEFDAAIQQMKPGEIAGPVRTMYGFHVIKLDKADDERQLQFEEVSAKIRTSLVESERDALYKQWMSNLKEKYPLERLDQ
jgi:parvulin-like peptidyl-prolyl isomerase